METATVIYEDLARLVDIIDNWAFYTSEPEAEESLFYFRLEDIRSRVIQDNPEFAKWYEKMRFS